SRLPAAALPRYHGVSSAPASSRRQNSERPGPGDGPASTRLRSGCDSGWRSSWPDHCQKSEFLLFQRFASAELNPEQGSITTFRATQLEGSTAVNNTYRLQVKKKKGVGRMVKVVSNQKSGGFLFEPIQGFHDCPLVVFVQPCHRLV